MQSTKERLGPSSSGFSSALLLAPILVLVACAGSIPSPETPAGGTPSNQSSAQAEPTASPAEAPPAKGSQPDEASASPVRYRPKEPQDVFPPAPADGLTGIAVPAIVSEPVAVYKTSLESLALAETLVRTLEPKPKRRSGPPRARGPVTETEPSIQSSGAPAATIDRAASVSVAPEPAALTPALSTSFDSLDFDDNAANTTGFYYIPPDPSGAAGPNHVMNVTNVSVQIHTKTGTKLLDSTAGAPITGISLASFFTSLSPVNDLFDPKVIYDQHAGRFVVVALERQDDCPAIGDPTDSSRILVAVSDDSDPTLPGTWYFTSIPSMITIGATPTWADYPGFAVDEEAVYITMNQFSFGSGMACSSTFVDDRLWVIDKVAGAGGGFYGGGTATVSIFDPSGTGSGIFSFTHQPAHIFGTAPTTPNVGTWLTLFSGLTGGGTEFVQVVRFDDPIGPGTPTFVGPSFVSLGNIDDLGGPPIPSPPSGTATPLDAGDRRALHAVWRDNHRLYTTFTIDPESGDPNDGEATAHWVIMNTATLAGSPPPVPLVDQGDIGGEDIATDTHTFYPSIAVNDSHDVAIGFSAAGGAVLPGSYYTTRKASDPVSTTSGSFTLRAGLDDYLRTFGGGSNRWGDYSGIAVDPFDQCFWVYNEHAIANGTLFGGENGRWGTAWGYFCESCPTQPATVVVPSGTTVTGTQTERAHDQVSTSVLTVASGGGDLTLSSALVSIGNGLTVATGGLLTIEDCP